MRNSYRNRVDYESGFAVLQTARTLSSVGASKGRKYPNSKFHEPTSDHAIVLDLANFLEYFSEPLKVAAYIESRAKETLVKWRKANSSRQSLGRRRPANLNSEICRYTWRSRAGDEECSMFQWQINSYKHTLDTKDENTPKIVMSDLKVRERGRRLSLSLSPPHARRLSRATLSLSLSLRSSSSS